MEIEFNFKKVDWLAFNKYYIDQDKLLKKTNLGVSLLLPGLLLFYLIIDGLNHSLSLHTIIGYGILSFLWIIFIPIRVKKGALKKLNILIQEKDNLGLLGKHRIVLKEDGLIRCTQESEYKIFWESIKKPIETNNYYFLFDTTFSAIIIPKKEINNLEFEDYLKSKLNVINQMG